jgi:hypothetical protein
VPLQLEYVDFWSQLLVIPNEEQGLGGVGQGGHHVGLHHLGCLLDQHHGALNSTQHPQHAGRARDGHADHIHTTQRLNVINAVRLL